MTQIVQEKAVQQMMKLLAGEEAQVQQTQSTALAPKRCP
jgi:hypothetical protein